MEDTNPSTSTKSTAATKRVAYKRGRYNTTPILYREKVRKNEDSNDCEPLYKFIIKTKEDLKARFKPSYNRSRILNNMQGLLDALTKQIKRRTKIEKERNQAYENRIQQLEYELEQTKLERQKEQMSQEDWIQELLVSDYCEDFINGKESSL